MVQQSAKPRILIVNDDPTASELMRLILTNEGYQTIIVTTAEEGYEEILTRPLNMAILDTAIGMTGDLVMSGMDSFTLCRRIRQHPPTRNLPILMLTVGSTMADKMSVFEAGADDLLPKPFQPQELIYRVKSLLVRAAATVPPPTQQRKRGAVIAFFGTKGGVGKTTVAVNLAVTLQQRTRKKVILFDGDFFFGDVGVHLNLTGGASVTDIVKHGSVLEPSFVDQTLITHSSGLQVLLGPHDPSEAELIAAEHVKNILDFLSGVYDYVVVDCPSNYDDRTLMLLEQATDIMLIVTPEVGPIRNAKVFFELVSNMGMLASKIHIVLNRSNSNVGIEAGGIERTLQHQVEFRLDSGGRQVARSVNHGVPLVIEQPDHPVAQQIFRLAQQLVKNMTKA
jgi:pilus assembly protein CpaE